MHPSQPPDTMTLSFRGGVTFAGQIQLISCWPSKLPPKYEDLYRVSQSNNLPHIMCLPALAF